MNDPFLSPDEPVLMGIVNVTPDSFSDGGRYFSAERAIAHGLRLRDEGAQILDIGGESTRPGSEAVSLQEELDRVLPVIEALRNSGAMISVDTRNAAVMKAAIKAGAGMINDITALTHDADSITVAADSGAYVCLMHMKGEPKTMQEAPQYDDVFKEVYGYLEKRVEECVKNGVARHRIIVDPGIGFGKTLSHNLILLNNIDKFKSLNVKILLGASRKRFIDHIVSGASEDHRLPGSLAACLSAHAKGIKIFRVHDVAETAQALKVFRAIEGA